MSKQRITVLVLIILCLLSLLISPATAMDSGDFAINWSVMGSGGETSSSANYALEATIGQPSIGFKSSTNYTACSGFWCAGVFAIYLPAILRNFSG